MKIGIPFKENNFNILAGKFCGLDCYLITPQIDTKWSKDNLFFRSLITDKEGNILSCGFPKFFNHGEKEDCYPNPEKFNDWKFEDKIDGSLLIADYVNEQFSMRTRGTFSYITQENSKDFELLPEKHPKIAEFLKENQHITLLFEIVTPNNIIVIKSNQIEFYLIGAINKEKMCSIASEELADIWRKIGPIPTPQSYKFLDTNKIVKIAETIKQWKGKEGIVISYNNSRNRIKLKSDWYLFCHRVKSQMSSKNNLIEFYVEKEMPQNEEFYKIIEAEFDYEIAVQLKEDIEKISNAGEKAKNYIKNISEMVFDIRKVENRKLQAQMIKTNYPDDSAYAFSLLDNKEINKTQWFKLIEKKYEC